MPEVTVPPDIENLARCQEAIGYRFQNLDLLHAALTHASGADSRLASNERLEFLGDAILGGVVCELLFRRFPEYLEGELTRVKSVVVSRRTCMKLSRQLNLQHFLILGKGMTTQAHVPPSVMADVFESLVAAMYLDGGIDVTRDFIHRAIAPEIERAVSGYHGGNYKSILQQLSQKQYGFTPIYQVLDEKGPDHSKCFKVAAQINRQSFPPAWGRNKKDAEQRAACNALCQINGHELPSDFDDEPLVPMESEQL
jgi:ribonuclease-3